MTTNDIHSLLERIIAEPDNRYELKKEVGKLGRSAVRPLVDPLQANSPELREAAAIGIEGIASNQRMIDLEGVILDALKPLIQTLQDDSPTVRKAALGALRQVLHSYYVNSELVDMLNPGLRNLVCRGVGPLVSMLDDRSIDVRLAAARALHHSGIESLVTPGETRAAERAREMLIAALDHESPEVRKFAAGQFLFFELDENVKKKAEEVRRSFQ
jgi:HEAT repeat protein